MVTLDDDARDVVRADLRAAHVELLDRIHTEIRTEIRTEVRAELHELEARLRAE